jgi:glycosyltransferase involved in cell wall biosynthesis
MLFEKTVEKADIFIVPNVTAKKELTKYVESHKIEIINFGVDMSTYRTYEYSGDENNYDIVYGGSAIERKGVKYLLEALPLVKKHFPDVKLHLMASGYKVEEYKTISKQLGIAENVIFHGMLEKEKYLAILSNSRLLCLPTLSDSYAWTVLDAVCTGVPVVATTECKCDDLFDNGEIGIKVETRSSDQLADAILTLFNDFELCRKFSNNGLEKRDLFDFNTIIPKYIKLYEKYM